jgi:3'-phosphoadenosine 5'-phosphosulfate sulfotransferase (PAPS reductase)/FAD synthetase
VTPDLGDYDVILVNSSAGKDSQAMLDLVVERAEAAGVRDRLVVVHADLGRMEWGGTRELAEKQAAHYDLRFEVVTRAQGDLLSQVAARGKWPDAARRYCTSDHKRSQVYRLLTQLAAEVRGPLSLRGDARPARILNCMGLRAAESPARAKKAAFGFDKMASNGRRHVDTWLPIFDWSEDDVWARIRESGVPHHRAYDLGMKRLSCVFCIFAPRAALIIAGRHNRDLLDSYVAVEQRIGHTFKKSLPIVEIRAAIERGDAAGDAAGDDGCWNM